MISNSAPERKDVSVAFLSNRQLRVLVFFFVFFFASHIFMCKGFYIGFKIPLLIYFH